MSNYKLLAYIEAIGISWNAKDDIPLNSLNAFSERPICYHFKGHQKNAGCQKGSG